MDNAPTDPVTAYARDVVAGKYPACRLHLLACRRHLQDLKDGKRRGLTWDLPAALSVIKFFENLRHYKGEWAGKPFVLDRWQRFLIGSVFGWKRADGTRRFRTAYVEVPRKNGKSMIAAGVALFLAFFDGEAGAECYCAATKRDQARIVFDAAKRMVQMVPALKKRIGIQVGNLHSLATASKLEPLGADADTMDGLNIHGAVIDELHAHKTRAVVDVMETATAARRQPLQFEITTAGYDRESVCWKHHAYTGQVLDGTVDDDTWFGFVAGTDEGDDWRDPSVWAKANPGLGISVKLDDLERKAKKAEQMPADQNAFRRLHLDEWTESAERWLDGALWDACGESVDEDELVGRPCYAGLDLAATTDIAALVLVFPDEDGGYDVVGRFWVPEDGARKRAEKDRVPYLAWIDQGIVRTTPGNVTDYDVIREDIRELAERYDLRAIAYDRWGATQLVTQLTSDGANCVPLGQGFASMSAPAKELEKLVLGKRLRHGGNPVLRWMAGNVCIEQDAAGNIKPSKRKSTERIDGIVALCMAIDQATRQTSENELSPEDAVVTWLS